MKILIAIEEDEGINSKLSNHFGHCKNFAIYETETEKLEIIKNELNHHDPNSSPVDQLKKHSLNTVISSSMGRKAIELFKKENIEVKIGTYTTVKEVIANLDTLKEIKKGCNHEHN